MSINGLDMEGSINDSGNGAKGSRSDSAIGGVATAVENVFSLAVTDGLVASSKEPSDKDSASDRVGLSGLEDGSISVASGVDRRAEANEFCLLEKAPFVV